MTDPQLLSMVLEIQPLKYNTERPLPMWWGRAAYALVLQVIQSADPNLAQSLHDNQGPQPFTASSLYGITKSRSLDLQKSFTMRITGLTQPINNLLIKAVEPGGMLAPGAVLELDFLKFKVNKIYTDENEHAWAGQMSYQALADQFLPANQKAENKVGMKFLSPTLFKTRERFMPIPLPELVFGHLLDKWNNFAPAALHEDTRRYAEECLVINFHKLSSRVVKLKEQVVRVGTTGNVRYTSIHYDRYWMSLIQTLAAFAKFAGLGASSSMGLGQCMKEQNHGK